MLIRFKTTDGYNHACRNHAARLLMTGELPDTDGGEGPLKLEASIDVKLQPNGNPAHCDWCADGDRAENTHQLVADARSVLWPEGDTTSEWGADTLGQLSAVLAVPEADHG